MRVMQAFALAKNLPSRFSSSSSSSSSHSYHPTATVTSHVDDNLIVGDIAFSFVLSLSTTLAIFIIFLISAYLGTSIILFYGRPFKAQERYQGTTRSIQHQGHITSSLLRIVRFSKRLLYHKPSLWDIWYFASLYLNKGSCGQIFDSDLFYCPFKHKTYSPPKSKWFEHHFCSQRSSPRP